MVKTRAKEDAVVFKEHYEDMIDKFGSVYTLYRDSVEMDSTGSVISATTSSSATVNGDFQRIEDEEELTQYGLTAQGGAKFYTKAASNIQPNDLILFNSKYWQFKRRIDDDNISGSEVAEVWLMIRLDG